MTKRNNKIKIIKKALVLTGVGVAVILLGVALELTNVINLRKSPVVTAPTDSAIPQQTNTVDYGPPRREDLVISPEKSNKATSNTANENKNNLSVAITRASRSLVSVYIEKINGGTCTLSISQNGVEKIAMSSGVIVESNYSTCEGFDIDTSKLGPSPFTVKLSVITGNRSGSATQEVD